MLVAGFYENKSEYIPDAFYDVLPIKCAESTCGFPMVMSETLNNLQCSNPYCPSKLAWRMCNLLNKIGVNYINELSLKKYIINGSITNIFSIFTYDYKIHGLLEPTLTEHTCENLTSILKEKNKFTLKEYIHSAGLPFLQDSIDRIFEQVTDLIDFYEHLQKSGYLYLCDLLGLDSTKEDLVSVRVLKIVEIFNTYKEELLQGISYVNIEE